jgi:hypothetical protein
LDLLDPPLELIENNGGALDECAAIHRRCEPFAGSVDKAQADRMFHIGNRLRHGRLRNPQMGSGFDHAARLDHCQEDMQIP